MPNAVDSTFTLDGHRLAYTVYGEGPRVIVLVHGLLLSQRMHAELAKALADRGNRVITLDLLGHGRSDRPPDMWRYSMTTFGAEVIALLDHLEVDEAVVLGTSLGANTALEAAALAPERLRGMVTTCSTPCASGQSRARPCCRACSSGARRRTAPSAARSRRRRS
jgi:pimeloyl-ACP methyl ester carboxylesterase